MRPGIVQVLPDLLRRSRSGTVALLGASAVLVATLVVTLAVGVHSGLERRGDRTAWRVPAATLDVHVENATTAADATMLQRDVPDVVDGQPIDIVQVAELQPGAGTAPPGVTALPTPGTSVVSPKLAELIETYPAGELGDRFGTVVGTIGEEALAGPDDLVAVIGVTPEQLAPDGATPGVPVAWFATTENQFDTMMFGVIGLVLVLVPAVMLVGASSRLTAASRERRLAALRLAGATPADVRRVTLAEVSLGAIAGAGAGVVLAWLIAPVLSLLELNGTSWWGSDLRPGWSTMLTILLTALVATWASAVVALRRVGSRPLAVARSEAAPPARAPPPPGPARARRTARAGGRLGDVRRLPSRRRRRARRVDPRRRCRRPAADVAPRSAFHRNGTETIQSHRRPPHRP